MRLRAVSNAARFSPELDAAVQILETEGAQRFTTARVAERGRQRGLALPILPNKAAILFRLQTDEWSRTSTMLTDILADRSRPPDARLRALVHAFIRSECGEAAIRTATPDPAPFYRDAPDAEAAHAESAHIVEYFLRGVAPDESPERRTLAGTIKTTLMGNGSAFSAVPRRLAEIEAYADELANMLCAYLDRISGA